jgi:uncharacterized protein (UPF0297 family)
MQDIFEAYPELSALIKKGTKIKYIDLWHDQTNAYDDEDLPYNLPGVFFEFVSNPNTIGNDAQEIPLLINVYLTEFTLADTEENSKTKYSAMQFARNLKAIYKALQNKSGKNFGPLNRIAMSRVPGNPAYITYVQTFTSELIDYSAQPEMELAQVTPGAITPGTKPTTPQNPLFQID